MTTDVVVDLVVGGAARRATLRMPTVGQVHVLMADDSLHRSAESTAAARRIEMFDVIATVDDAPVSWSLAADVADVPSAVLAIRAARDARVEEEVGRGRPDVSSSYGTRPRAASSERGLPAPAMARLPDPALRSVRPGGVRPVDFTLPSGTTGTLDWLDPVVEAVAWTRWAPVGLDPIDGRDDWTFESAGFRAVLRLSCALVRLGDLGPDDLAPEAVEALTLADFLFLDELYRTRWTAEGRGTATRG